MARAVTKARAAFDAATGAAGLTTDWWQIRPDEYGEVVGWTIVCCRHVDLAIFGQRDPGRPSALPDDLIEQVIAKSGRPVLVVPHFGHHAEIGKRVLVAWSGSREAARALNDAIPLLQRAERVRLLALQQRGAPATVPGPPVDVVAHLRLHGIEAEYARVAVDDLGAVANVLNGAAELMADLVVMGDHEGGAPFGQGSTTTRDLLSSMTTAVLLSH
jgi:nucleotide-binding universal stress UspA family protein